MKMNINITATVIAAIIVSCLSACKITISRNEPANNITKDYTVGDFTSVRSSVYDVVFTPGEKFSVRAEGDEKEIEKMKIKVDENGVLTILESVNTGKNIIHLNYSHNNVKVYVTAPTLSSVTITGSGTFTCNDTIYSDKIELAIAGSGEIDVKHLKCSTFVSTVAGSGEIEVDSISAANTEFSIAGSGDIDVKNLSAEISTITISGSGDITLNCNDCGTVNASVAGSGDIQLTGKAKYVHQSVSGSGNIDVSGMQK